MRESRRFPVAVLLAAALALFVIPSAPALAQEAGAAAVPPRPQMSDAAGQMLDEAVAGTHRDGLELEIRPFFFPSLEGGTFSFIAFETSTDGLEFAAGEAAADGSMPPAVAEMEVFVAVLQGGEEVQRFGGPFTVEEGAATDGFSRTYSVGTMLDPGSHDLVWGVRDRNSGVAGTRQDTVEVPDFATGGLQLTSVLASTGVTQTQDPLVPGAVFPGVRVANLLVDDDIDRVFEPTQQVELIYVVMGAQADPATGTHSIENTYRILDAEGNGVVRFPPQQLNRTSVGQPIPLSRIDNLEAGAEYSFEIVTKDLVAGTETTTMVPFRIAGEAAPEEME